MVRQREREREREGGRERGYREKTDRHYRDREKARGIIRLIGKEKMRE